MLSTSTSQGKTTRFCLVIFWLIVGAVGGAESLERAEVLVSSWASPGQGGSTRAYSWDEICVTKPGGGSCEASGAGTSPGGTVREPRHHRLLPCPSSQTSIVVVTDQLINERFQFAGLLVSSHSSSSTFYLPLPSEGAIETTEVVELTPLLGSV